MPACKYHSQTPEVNVLSACKYHSQTPEVNVLSACKCQCIYVYTIEHDLMIKMIRLVPLNCVNISCKMYVSSSYCSAL